MLLTAITRHSFSEGGLICRLAILRFFQNPDHVKRKITKLTLRTMRLTAFLLLVWQLNSQRCYRIANYKLFRQRRFAAKNIQGH